MKVNDHGFHFAVAKSLSERESVFELTTLTNPFQGVQKEKIAQSTFEPIDFDDKEVTHVPKTHITKEKSKPKIKSIEEIRIEKDQEHAKTYEEYLNSGKLPKAEEFSDFKDYLFTLQVYSAAEKDYDKAEKIGNDIATLNQKMKELAEKQQKQKEMDVTQFYKENTEFEHKNFNMLWDIKFAEVKEEFDRRFAELHEKHKQELDDFEAKWNDPSYLRTYSKVSSRILELKAREESQSKSKMWKEAKETSRRMQSLIKSESKMKQRQASMDMEKELAKIKSRHKQEEENLNVKYKNQISVLQASKNNEEKPFFIRKTILMRRSTNEKENITPNVPRLNIKKTKYEDKPIVLSIKPMGIKSSMRKKQKPKLLF